MRRSAVEGRRLLDFTCARDHHLGRRALVSYMVSDNYGKKQDDGQPSSETIILVWTIVLNRDRGHTEMFLNQSRKNALHAAHESADT
jgi:hypothetical protein